MGLARSRLCASLRQRFTRRRGAITGIGVEDDIGVGLSATARTRGGRVRRGWRRGLYSLAKKQAAKPSHRDLGFLQGKHQPTTRADDLLQPTRYNRW